MANLDYDIINCVFELFAGCLTILNIRSLLRDKDVKGVSLVPAFVFLLWGFYNAILFYPHLNQWMSWGGGCVMLASNLTWFGLAVRYKYFYPTKE